MKNNDSSKRTNYERIIHMTIEELAAMLIKVNNEFDIYYCSDYTVHDTYEEALEYEIGWLKVEAEE